MSVRRNAPFVTNKTVPSTMAVIVDPDARRRVEAYAKARDISAGAALRELVEAGLKSVANSTVFISSPL